MKRKKKCRSWSKSALWCDGCKTTSSKCPMRDKYRYLRNTKYGKEKYQLSTDEV